MKKTKENIALLKKLGYEIDAQGYYSDNKGWGFLIECMPNFKTLLRRRIKSAYNDGYDDAKEKKRRKFGTPQDR